MGVRIKVCGVTTPEAAIAAGEAGVDAVGFVFAASPRHVDIGTARRLADALPPFVSRVAVFRHPTAAHVAEVVEGFRPDLVQAEPDTDVWRAVDGRVGMLPVFHDGSSVLEQVRAYTDAHGSPGAVLLEAPGRGGRGVAPDWRRARVVAGTVRLVLAGGLHADNVREAIRTVRPYAVDVSSGVESAPGVKDPAGIVAFVRAVRDTDYSQGDTTA